MVLAAAITHVVAAQTGTTLAVPNRANSTPWVAASGSFVAVTWGATANGKGDIFVATSRDGGHTFSTPVRVNAIEGDARISGEIAPRVALSSRSSALASGDHRDVECERRHDRDQDGALA